MSQTFPIWFNCTPPPYPSLHGSTVPRPQNPYPWPNFTWFSLWLDVAYNYPYPWPNFTWFSLWLDVAYNYPYPWPNFTWFSLWLDVTSIITFTHHFLARQHTLFTSSWSPICRILVTSTDLVLGFRVSTLKLQQFLFPIICTTILCTLHLQYSNS